MRTRRRTPPRVPRAEQKRCRDTGVDGDDVGAVDPQRVEHTDHVVGTGHRVETVAGASTAPEAPKVRGDDTTARQQ
jgi:hypothetical protein